MSKVLLVDDSAVMRKIIQITSGVKCNSQNSWLMTPFSSNGSTFNVGFVVKKND